MQLSQGWIFFPLHAYMLHPFERKIWWTLVSEFLSPRDLTPLTDASMLLSLEGDECDPGHLIPDCRIEHSQEFATWPGSREPATT